MLELYKPSDIPACAPSPPPPVIIDGAAEYKVSEVLDSKIDRRRRCSLLYLIRWAGYEGTDEELQWLPADKLEHAQEAIADFHEAYPNKPSPNIPPRT